LPQQHKDAAGIFIAGLPSTALANSPIAQSVCFRFSWTQPGIDHIRIVRINSAARFAMPELVQVRAGPPTGTRDYHRDRVIRSSCKVVR